MSWEANVRQVEPYVAGEQPKACNVIKLNTNECPYPPAPGVARIAAKMDYDRFRLYPDMNAEPLVNALAEYYHVRPSQVFVGVGSDDVLAMSFLTFFNSEKPILFPDITYSFYDVWAELFRIPYKVCALDESFRMKKEDYFQPNGGIIFPNPNAPTGVLEDVSVIEEIIAKNPASVVIVDEAYRGRGYGRRVCEALLSEAIQRGAHTAYLQVVQNNQPAICLYKKLGYKKLYSYWYRVKHMIRNEK